MKKKTVLFDLDGTLLPMDPAAFLRGYFGGLAKKLAPCGYTLDELTSALWGGVGAMIRSDGHATCEEIFWAYIASLENGGRFLHDKALFDDFYRHEFEEVRAFCSFAPQAAPLVRVLKSAGYTVALATNPFFPRAATEARVRWAGLAPADFALITTYENSRFCKPNPAYFAEVIDALGVSAADCLMIGNDVKEDGAARKLGIPVFLLTPCLIDDTDGSELAAIPHGDFDALNDWLNAALA